MSGAKRAGAVRSAAPARRSGRRRITVVRRRRDRAETHAELCVMRATVRRLTAVRPVAKNGLRPGVVVWAHVPFAGGNGTLRPAVVTTRHGRTVVVQPITARPYRLTQPGYRPLLRWEEAGLVRRSAVRLLAVPIALADVVSIVGALQAEDLCAPPPGRVLTPGVSSAVGG